MNLVPDDQHSSRRLLVDYDVLQTLESCFEVINESNKVENNPTVSVLAQRKSISGSTQQIAITSYLNRFLTLKVYKKIRRRQTRLNHNLFDVIWPALRKTSKLRKLEEDINCGIIAPDFDVFVVFQEFLVPLLRDMHCLNITAEFKPHPQLAYFPFKNDQPLNTATFKFIDYSKLIKCCIVECSRNLDYFELPLNLTIGQIEKVERIILSKLFNQNFLQIIKETETGHYFTLTELLEDNSTIRQKLLQNNLMIPLLYAKDAENIAFNGKLWPYGRGVYVTANYDLAIWINCQEHLRIISATKSHNATDIGSIYTLVGRTACYLEKQLHFKQSYFLGYLQSRPAYLGTGLKFITVLHLPNLMKELDNLRHLCYVRGLNLETNLMFVQSIRLLNMQSLGKYEFALFQDYCTAITNILSLEKDMSLSNSKQIAAMLIKIFRRKKNSIIDLN